MRGSVVTSIFFCKEKHRNMFRQVVASIPSSTLLHQAARGIKTKSSAKKRFKVLGNGTIKRWQANKRHINAKHTRKKIRQLGDSKDLKGYQINLGKKLLGLK